MTNPELRTSRVAWGQVRDALAAVHNLETLLKSPRVSAGVLAGLLPELHASCVALRGAFTGEQPSEARKALAQFALERLTVLEHSMNDAGDAAVEVRTRLALEQVVVRVSGELDASVELLDLIERAEAPTPTELSLEELARASLRIGGGIARGEEIVVRIDAHHADCVLVADAHVVARLVAAAVARMRSRGAHQILLKATCAEHEVLLDVSAAGVEHATLPVVSARLAAQIPPTDLVVAEAARAIGGRISATETGTSLAIPRS